MEELTAAPIRWTTCSTRQFLQGKDGSECFILDENAYYFAIMENSTTVEHGERSKGLPECGTDGNIRIEKTSVTRSSRLHIQVKVSPPRRAAL
jgi:hypothetical protein